MPGGLRDIHAPAIASTKTAIPERSWKTSLPFVRVDAMPSSTESCREHDAPDNCLTTGPAHARWMVGQVSDNGLGEREAGFSHERLHEYADVSGPEKRAEP
jgi:hypothetical protein